MTKISCEIQLYSDSEHIQQLLTGFSILEKENFLSVKVSKHINYDANMFGVRYLKVIFEQKIHVIYDMSDEKTLAYTHSLDSIDYYFKRSYDFNYLSTLNFFDKIYEYGFNYLAYSNNSYWIKRILWSGSFKRKLINIVRSQKFLSNSFNIQNAVNTSHYLNFEQKPLIQKKPKILFLTRTWKPDRMKDKEKKEERIEINTQRANIIRLLKKEFKNDFVGGFSEDDYTRKYFSDCIVPQELTHKKNYLRILKDSSICIATKGLENSNGWKLAEYISASKAIVTEPLFFQVGKSFQKDKNYLTFKDHLECIDNVSQLQNDKNLRYEMMENNYRYYHSFLRPDSIILNSIMRIYTN